MSDEATTIDITPKQEEASLTKRGYTPQTLDEYARVGSLAMKSRLCGVSSIEDATVMLLTGAELGLGPMQSLRGIHVVKGKPVLSADMLAAVCLASPACIYMYPKEMTATSCTYTTMRRGMPEPCTMTYTIEDAGRAGLTGSPTWKRHPQAMLKARCVAQMARAIYPDLTLGVYVEDEGDEIAGKHHDGSTDKGDDRSEEEPFDRPTPDLNDCHTLMRSAGVGDEQAEQLVNLWMGQTAGKGKDPKAATLALHRKLKGMDRAAVVSWVTGALEEVAA